MKGRRTRALLVVAWLLLSASGHAQDTSENEEEFDSVNVETVYAPDVRLQNNTRELLKDEDYRFCQDRDYRLFEAEKSALCQHVETLERTCPALLQACQRPAWEADMEREEDPWFDWDAFGWSGQLVSQVGRLFFWLSLGLGLLVLLRALFRRARLWRDERKLEQTSVSHPITSEESDAIEPFGSKELFERARAALEQGSITQSLDYTYRGTIRALADAEWVKPHRSKTSGDYQQLILARQESDSSSLDRHLRDLDRERFHQSPQVEKARHLLEQALHLATRLGQLSLILLALLLNGCSEGVSVPELPFEAHGPRGGHLFEQLLRSRAPSVHRRVVSLTDVPESTSVVVALSPRLRRLEWEVLQEYVSDGGRLVLSDPDQQFMDVFGLHITASGCPEPLVAPDLSLVSFFGNRKLEGDTSGQVLAHCGADPFASSFSYNGGRLTLIADERLFENASLAAADNASFAFALLGNLDGHVEFVGPWTGGGAHHPLQTIGRAGFGWWVLHVLLLAALYALSRGKRFGAPQDPPERQRRAFSEHARALSQKYERSRASGWALRAYAEWALDALRRRAPSTKSDLKSLTRAVSATPRQAAQLRQALTTARRADELGESEVAHHETFRTIKRSLERDEAPPKTNQTKD